MPVAIEPIEKDDWVQLTKTNFFFDWKKERGNELWKLTRSESTIILGVMSLIDYPAEYRIEIHLLASRRQEVGQKKIYSRIAGCLIAWACRLAAQRYGPLACVCLIPKTELRSHYMDVYGMSDAGWQLFLEEVALHNLIDKYIDESP